MNYCTSSVDSLKSNKNNTKIESTPAISCQNVLRKYQQFLRRVEAKMIISSYSNKLHRINTMANSSQSSTILDKHAQQLFSFSVYLALSDKWQHFFS